MLPHLIWTCRELQDDVGNFGRLIGCLCTLMEICQKIEARNEAQSNLNDSVYGG